MTITADQVRQLREMTGAGMMECKKALSETGGDLNKAIDALRKAGIAKAEKRAGRSASQGRVEAYVHDSRIGVLIEVNCETDFVARTDDFRLLCKDLAMQVAAAGAEYVRREEVPAERISHEREIYTLSLHDALPICTRKSSVRATKSVSQFTSTRTPMRLSCTYDSIRPCEIGRAHV